MLLCIVTFSACDASRPAEVVPPEPGELTVLFQTSHDAEGAVRVRLEGPGIGAIATTQAGALAFSRADGSRHEVFVLGTLESGVLLRFDVPDLNRFEEYGASIVEVAGMDNALRGDLEGYAVEILR